MTSKTDAAVCTWIDNAHIVGIEIGSRKNGTRTNVHCSLWYQCNCNRYMVSGSPADFVARPERQLIGLWSSHRLFARRDRLTSSPSKTSEMTMAL